MMSRTIPTVVTFVGDLEEDVRVTAFGDPVHGVDHRPFHRFVVLESLILPEIEDAEHDHHAEFIGAIQNPFEPGHVVGPQ
jgi:hypothetical protein